VPTAVVVNDDDGVVPTARQYDLAERIPDAATFVVAGGHAVCTTAPGRFLPALVAACRHVCGSLAPMAPAPSMALAAPQLVAA
jgi:3-oxoadipate enol-lactonase